MAVIARFTRTTQIRCAFCIVKSIKADNKKYKKQNKKNIK